MSVTEVKAKFEAAKKAVESLQKRQVELTRKLDDLRENLPLFQRRIADARTERAKVFDAMVLGESSKDDLKRCDKALEQAEREYSESQEIYDALLRGVKNCETELPKLHTESEIKRRECWLAVADEMKSAISSEVFESVRRLQVIGSQCGQTRQWILDSLFQNPSSGEHQEIFGQLSKEHGIE